MGMDQLFGRSAQDAIGKVSLSRRRQIENDEFRH